MKQKEIWRHTKHLWGTGGKGDKHRAPAFCTLVPTFVVDSCQDDSCAKRFGEFNRGQRLCYCKCNLLGHTFHDVYHERFWGIQPRSKVVLLWIQFEGPQVSLRVSLNVLGNSTEVKGCVTVNAICWATSFLTCITKRFGEFNRGQTLCYCECNLLGHKVHDVYH